MAAERLIHELGVSLPYPENQLLSISPVDGRYAMDVAELAPYVSEFGLIKTRAEVEAVNLIALGWNGVIDISDAGYEHLEGFGKNLTIEQAQRVKEIEKTSEHDVKAVELMMREEFAGTGLESISPFIHFPLTSEDVNNLS